jgi:hypothetical protein
MSGRPVRLLAAAAIAAAASLFSIGAASANCYGCGSSVVYQAPVVSYAAPVVYGYSYQAPVAYPAPVQYSPGCGCAAQAPMFVVNQGPAFNAPVIGEADPIPVFRSGYRRAYPYFGGGHVRWHHRGWNRGYHRGYGPRLGYRGYGPRSFSYRGYGHRYGVGARYSMRHPVVAPRGMRHGGMNRVHGPRHPMAGPGRIQRAPSHAGGARPGSVYPIPTPTPRQAP